MPAAIVATAGRLPAFPHPTVHEIAPDLLQVGRARRWFVVGRPFVLASVFFATARCGLWPLAVAVVPVLFVSQVVALNELVHRSLGFRSRSTTLLTTLVGLLVFDSGHAITVTHLGHHERGGGDGDPESYVDLLDTGGLVRETLRYRVHLWRWGWRHDRSARGFLVLEMTASTSLLALAVVLSPATALYAGLVTVGCALFPVVSARGPQVDWGRQRAGHALVVRGRVLPALLLGLSYHLEHHLYPEVPSFRLAVLARRLDPWLAAAAVPVVEVW